MGVHKSTGKRIDKHKETDETDEVNYLFDEPDLIGVYNFFMPGWYTECGIEIGNKISGGCLGKMIEWVYFLVNENHTAVSLSIDLAVIEFAVFYFLTVLKTGANLIDKVNSFVAFKEATYISSNAVAHRVPFVTGSVYETIVYCEINRCVYFFHECFKLTRKGKTLTSGRTSAYSSIFKLEAVKPRCRPDKQNRFQLHGLTSGSADEIFFHGFICHFCAS